MHEIITLQIGQCGNQLGNEFWRRIADEHENTPGGRPDKFFYPGNIPRSIFIDSEPRAINKSYPNNCFIANDGIGAGNNFAQGYKIGQDSHEDIFELINRHAEASDNFEAFMFIHSTAGGTGSGFGGYLSDLLREVYGSKKVLMSFSILPANKESSEVVVQPYNTILTLDKLYKNMDSVILMDNYALGKQSISSNLINTNYNLLDGSSELTFDSLNDVASDVIANFTSSIRYPSFNFSTINSILAPLIPYQPYKFIIPSYIKSNNSLSEIMHNLIKHKTMLCDYEDSALYKSFSVMNNLPKSICSSGSSSLSSISNNIIRTSRITQPKINFYGLPFYLFNPNNSTSSLGLNNTSSVRNSFSKISMQFDRLRSKGAFMEIYKKYSLTEEMFDQARDNIKEIIKSYEDTEISASN